MPRALKDSEFTLTIALSSFWAILLSLALLLSTVGECADAEQAPPSIEPVPVAPGLLPPPQEQILSPIPRQFEWMRREIRRNPFLESLLGLREVTSGRVLVSVSLTEEYSDNFFLRERDREEEYRTSLNIGTVYRLESGRSFVSLANTISGAYDARAEESNFAFANLALNAGYQLPRLSLALNESFIRSDQVEDATPTGVRRERRTFTTNTLSPQLRYDLTRTTVVNGSYTNTLVWNEDEGRDEPATTAGRRLIEGDSVSHSFATGLQHQFTRNLSGGVSYTFTTVGSEEQADTLSHSPSADFAYIINPRTSATFRAFGTVSDRRNGATDVSIGETSFRTYGASFGVRRQLTTFLAAFVSAGPTIVDREDRPTRVFGNWQVSLDGALPITRRTSLSLSTQQSITDTAGDVDSVGLVLSQSAALTLNHSILRNLFASLSANFTRTELLEDIATNVSTQDREFTLWSTSATLSYALSPAWSLAGTYRYQRRNSDLPADTLNGTRLGGSFDENRVTLSLSAAFSIF